MQKLTAEPTQTRLAGNFWNRESWDWDTLAYSFHCIFWSISLIIFWKSFFLLQIIVINEPFLKIRLFWLEPQYCSFTGSRLGQSTDTDWKFCENATIFKRYRLRIGVNSKDRCMENFYKFGSGFDLSSTKSRHKNHHFFFQFVVAATWWRKRKLAKKESDWLGSHAVWI